MGQTQYFAVHIRNPFFISLLMHVGVVFILLLGFKYYGSTAPSPIAPYGIIELMEESALTSAELTESKKIAVVPALEKTLVKSKLDEGSVAGTASSDMQSTVPAEGQVGQVNGSREATLEDRYKYELRQLLDRRKIYPRQAKTMGYSGVVLIELTLDANGQVLSKKIVQGSHPILNEAAEVLVAGISGQKPFPEGLTKTTWSFQVPIEYALR